MQDLRPKSAELRRQQPTQQAAREQTAVQEECNSPATLIEDLEQAPADTAADGACELVLAVLSTPGPPQLTILGHLEQNDKLNLGTTCTSLRLASLTWFSELTVEVNPDKPDVASLAAWLKRHQVQLSLKLDPRTHKGDYLEWACSTIKALSPHSPLSGMRVLSLSHVALGSTVEEVLALPALKDLQALGLRCCELQTAPHMLSALTKLTALKLSYNRCMLASSALASLATLQRIESLDIRACCLQAVPQRLSALTAITRLELSFNGVQEGGWQHLLPLTRLQGLYLQGCLLTAVPELVSALTALTGLYLAINRLMAGGWQHLLPLTQLRDLSLYSCSLTAVPEQLAVLTALTHLNLSRNKELAGGWEHLLPMSQLRILNLEDMPLTGAWTPPELAALPQLRVSGLDH